MNRIYHTWDKWECYPAGFYDDKPSNGMKKDEAEEFYREFLSDPDRFLKAGLKMIAEWKNSCEHYLTNEKMNRIAWIGQASVCFEAGIPCKYRGGFSLLTEGEQKMADRMALIILNKWLQNNGHKLITEEEAASKTAANLY